MSNLRGDNMKIDVTKCLFLAILAALVVPVRSFSAEAVKFKPVLTEYLDEKGGNLKYPEGIACTKKSSIIVADTGNGRLVRYVYQNDSLKATPEIKIPQLAYPIRVRVNSKDDIFVLDEKQRRIVHLNPEGVFVGYVEPQNMPESAAVVPKSFAIDSHDDLYILDIRKEQVIVLDQAGKILRSLPFPPEYGFFSDITVDTKGNIFLLDSVKDRAFIATADAKTFQPLTSNMGEYMDFAPYITTDSQGRIFLTDQNGSAVVLLGQDGSFQGRQLNMGWKPGFVYFPAQACVTDAGDFFIADRNNSRIQLFKLVK